MSLAAMVQRGSETSFEGQNHEKEVPGSDSVTLNEVDPPSGWNTNNPSMVEVSRPSSHRSQYHEAEVSEQTSINTQTQNDLPYDSSQTAKQNAFFAGSVNHSTHSSLGLPQLSCPSNSQLYQPTATFRLSRNHYVPSTQTRLLNNLLPLVGFLELTNALDFPANVWNTIPVPVFAVVLMATGGSIAIIFSFIAFYDLRLSSRNFMLLKEERRYLNDLKGKLVSEEKHAIARKLMCQAWLDLNFREIGWEFTDRMLMDSLNGFAGILVGVGTMLAIGGANPMIFKASNLLSGYIGNSFNLVYGAVNSVWSMYMWRRSRRYKRAVDEFVRSESLRARAVGHSRRSGLYAAVQGATVFVAAIGSMISATMWQGYVVLIPCVIGAIFTNLLWRRGVGYHRELQPRRWGGLDVDVEAKLVFVIAAQETIKSQGSHILLEGQDAKQVIDFMTEYEMFEDFCMQLLHDLGDRRTILGITRGDKDVVIDQPKLESVDDKQLVDSARQCLSRKGLRRLRDQERMLAELLGCRLSQQRQRRKSQAEIKSPVEKDV